ncbi:MBL fold metallo-hydrolase [Sphingomonas sp. CARO-RG-8B-R24-01]|uniref:MBL fold metallo-hydrolase n=1 Tax=Sphingomonas sp. CARO-RG-8B-R24-01 TaxID=2914831 RepID=UPI001F5AF843|nr:MBL fold metallo-hydrolase [Sphingomonas sp. CARO-RG-8B-R24-01]
MRVRILGSGTSSGVPRIGNDWGKCDPANPKNRRTRASVLIETATTRILVDTGPDMREQLLSAGVATVDAVIWTHDHADHTHGIDDLRQVYHALGSPVRGIARPALETRLKDRFGYIFQGLNGYPKVASLESLPDEIRIGDIDVRVADQPHGSIQSAGLRFEGEGGVIGYATDLSGMTEDMAVLYSGLDIWVVDALRKRPHPSHADLATALHWIATLQPRRAALTHMDQTMDYATLLGELPENVEPGYDGLVLDA